MYQANAAGATGAAQRGPIARVLAAAQATPPTVESRIALRELQEALFSPMQIVNGIMTVAGAVIFGYVAWTESNSLSQAATDMRLAERLAQGEDLTLGDLPSMSSSGALTMSAAFLLALYGVHRCTTQMERTLSRTSHAPAA